MKFRANEVFVTSEIVHKNKFIKLLLYGGNTREFRYFVFPLGNHLSIEL